jgi:hypothetical protein
MDLPGITDEDEAFTRLSAFEPDRVDLVFAGANGVPRFLIAKQDAGAGLFEPEYVRDLIAKTSPQEAPVPVTADTGETVLPNGITLKGSPAAMAAFIHAANVRKAETPGEPEPQAAEVAKAKYSADDLKKMLAAGHAIKNDNGDPSYPVGDIDDLGKAVNAVGRGGSDHDHIRAYVIRRAKALGASSEIPDNWNSDGSLKGGVSKEADVPESVAKDVMDAAGDAVPLDDGMDGMDPTTPFAAPDDESGLPGDPTDPGSPAWEGIDAATAHKWLAIAARLKNALLLLAERESLEAASADPDDIENAWSLEDAAAAVDYAIGNLAVFASGEKAEAEIGAECEEMCKALAAFDTAPLGVIEGLTAVAKSGRVLSSANEAAIRAASESLQKVLASLPEAPVAKQKEGAMPATTAETPAGPVAKADGTPASPEAQARDSGPLNAGGTTGMGAPRTTGPAEAAPADGPQGKLPGDVPGRAVVKSSHLNVVVYDRAGKQCHVRPDAIVAPVAKADGDDAEKPKMQAVFDQDGDLIGVVDPDAITPVAGAAAAPAADPAAPAPAADDDTPQPPAAAGIPADAVGKSAEQDVTTGQPADLDSIIAKAVTAALSAFAPAQDVAKSADVAGVNAEVELLKARLAKVEEMPAAPGVFTNGAVPPQAGGRPLPAQGQLRGQDAGGQSAVAKEAAGLKHELYNGTPARQNEVAGQMTRAAIAELTAIHSGARS